MRAFYLYIPASTNGRTLYLGVTDDIGASSSIGKDADRSLLTTDMGEHLAKAGCQLLAERRGTRTPAIAGRTGLLGRSVAHFSALLPRPSGTVVRARPLR
jgi:hypothetical protein